MGRSVQKYIGQVLPVSFSTDLRMLRIGCQLLTEDTDGCYVVPIHPSDADNNLPRYFEEFCCRGQFTAYATRRVLTDDDVYQSGLPDGTFLGFGKDFIKMEGRSRAVVGIASRHSKGSDTEDDESQLSSSMESTPASGGSQGYETWSECSSNDDANIQFEDDIITPWTGRLASLARSDSDFSDSPYSAERSSTDGNDARPNADADSSDTDSDLSLSAVVGFGRYRGDSSDDDLDDSDYDAFWAANAYHNYREKKAARSEPSASLVITDSSSPNIAFHFLRKAPILLYDSPPVIHPSHPFVVWPLGAGEVLFADFKAKTFFVRKLRPSTAYSQCNFPYPG